MVRASDFSISRQGTLVYVPGGSFLEGEPPRMTEAERTVLAAKGATGVRLSCQIICDHDMTVRAVSRLAGSGRPDPGRTPEPQITPPPAWIELNP